MFICLDAHEPLTIVDTKDGVIEKQASMSLNNIMSKGYKILGLTYKNNIIEIDRKYIGNSNTMDILNPHNSFKNAELVILRNRDAGVIYGIKTKDGKEAFRTTDKKFVEAKNLEISYLRQTEFNYIITFKYDNQTDVVTYVNGKRQNKLTVNKETNNKDIRINIKRTISATPSASSKFNKEVAEATLKKHKINAKVVEDKDLGLTKGYLCTDGSTNYWVLADGKIYRYENESFKIMYKPDTAKEKDKEEDINRLRNLIMDYTKANVFGDADIKSMEKAICEKLGIQRIVSMTSHNGYADMVIVVNDIQKKAKLDFRTCKLV